MARKILKLLLISMLLSVPSIPYAWEYVLDPILDCKGLLDPEVGTFTVVGADSHNDLIACGPLIGSEAPPYLHIAEVTSDAGLQAWLRQLPGSGNHRSECYCNSLTVGSADEALVAASTAAIDYQVRNFTVEKLLKDGQVAWLFSKGKPRGGDFSPSYANEAVFDPKGDVVAMGFIDLDNYRNVLIKLSGEDGTELWHRGIFPSLYQAVFPSTLAVDGLGDIFIEDADSSSPSGIHPLLVKVSSLDGAEIWRSQEMASSKHARGLFLDDHGNPIVWSQDVVSKLDSSNGGQIWSLAGNFDALLVSPTGFLLQVDSPHVIALSTATGQVIRRFELQGGSEACDHFANDRDGNILAICAGPVLVKWSMDGASLWRQETFGSAFVTDSAGDVTVAGSKSRIAFKRDCQDTYLDQMAILHKYWGKTGADFPPTAIDRVRYLKSLAQNASIDAGIAHSLMLKLDRAIDSLSDENSANDVRAAASLGAFVKELTALQGKKISTAASSELISEAEKAIEAIPAT